jgi:hypothetical protein
VELVEIAVGYDYQVLARHKRKREAQWTVASASLETAVPSVADADAPQVGVLREPGTEFVERYRTWEGRLYREVNGVTDPNRVDRLHVPLTLGEARRSGPLRVGNLGKVPWKWLEKDAVRQYDAVLAEVVEDRRARSLALVAPRARDLLVVDGVLYVPSDPPMLSVCHTGRPVRMLTGAEMESSDPEFSSYGNHYASLFRADRTADTVAYAAALEARLVGLGHLRAYPAPPDPPSRTLEISPGAEALFLVDDMVASARRNLSFACWCLNGMVMDLDGRAVRAHGVMRETVLAMERPEGRTRANARRAYEAVCAILEAEPGGWTGADASRLSKDEIERDSGHLRERYRSDPTFAPTAGETLAAADDAAIAELDLAVAL